MTNRHALLLLLVLAPGLPARALDFGAPLRVADTARTAHAPFSVGSILPDGDGSVAFGRMSKTPANGRVDIVAVPIDAAGTPHPEKAFVIAANASPQSRVAATTTATGYLVTFRDVEGDGYVVALHPNFSVAASPLVVSKDEPLSLACSGAVCAGVVKDALLLLDPSTARLLGRPSFPGARNLTALPNGFALSVLISFTTELIHFLDRGGSITASAVLPPVAAGVEPAALAPHPLGVAAFRPLGDRITAMAIRNDTSVAISTLLPAPQAVSFSVSAAVLDARGRYTLAIHGIASLYYCTCPPNESVHVLRVSDALQPLEQPALLAEGWVNSPVIASSGDNTIAAWVQTDMQGSRSLLIPAAGAVTAAASLPLPAVPASQTGLGIAASADRTLVLWKMPASNGGTAAYARRFDRNGSLDAEPIALHGSSGAVATDGRDFMIGAPVRLVSVDGDDGTVRSASSELRIMGGSIAWDGGGYVTVTLPESGYAVTRAAADGTPLWTRAVADYPYALAAVPGRTMVLHYRDGVAGFDIFDSAGTRIASKDLDRYPILVASNRRDQFLFLHRDNAGLGSVTRVGADGTLLDPIPRPIGAFTNARAAAALGDQWVLFVDNEAIEFPRLTRTPMPQGETAVAAAIASGGRAVLLAQRDEMVDGKQVKVLLLHELADAAGTPPRRRITR